MAAKKKRRGRTGPPTDAARARALVTAVDATNDEDLARTERAILEEIRARVGGKKVGKDVMTTFELLTALSKTGQLRTGRLVLVPKGEPPAAASKNDDLVDSLEDDEHSDKPGAP